jgi:integrase
MTAGLTAKRVKTLLSKGEPGRHFDKDGLYLAVTGRNKGHWLRRYERLGKGHWAGLGRCEVFTLAEARERNRRISQQLADGLDPLEEKRARKARQLAAAAMMLTFKEATERYIAQQDKGWTSREHAADYVSSLRRLAWPIIGALDVAAIDVPHVLAVLEQKVPEGKGYPAGILWEVRNVTADRLRNRVESVLDWSMARGHRPKGPNPAAWAGNLEHILPKPSKVARVNPHPALAYSEMPALMARLAAGEGTGARALRFLILTTGRAGEILGAVWSEIDLESREWAIPASRMKARREHRVPLSSPAIELLRSLPTQPGNQHLFIGTYNAALSDSTLAATLRRAGCDATVHGMRSTFATWAHERTAHSNHAIELSLAHSVGTEVEKRYRRGDLRDKRRRLMEDWAAYCCSPQTVTGEVVPLRSPGAA